MTTDSPLIKRLRRGWLSSAQWFDEVGSLKLTSRMTDVRRSHLGKRLQQRTVKKNGKSWCEYRLAR